MPIYEYSCSSCGRMFEELIVRSTDAEQVSCPSCSSGEVKRLISRPAASTSAGNSPGPSRGCGPVG